MGLFSRKAGASDPVASSNVKSEATTVVPSQNVSNSDLEKTINAETDISEKLSSERSSSPSSQKLDNPIEPTEVEIQNKKAHVEGEDSPGLSDEDQLVYPSGLKLGLICLALCLSVFLVALDNTIIATAIPKITDHFKSLQDVGWYGSSYLLTTCALQLFFGK